MAAIIIGTGTNACYVERTDAIIKSQGLITSSGKMVLRILLNDSDIISLCYAFCNYVSIFSAFVSSLLNFTWSIGCQYGVGKFLVISFTKNIL